MDVVIWKWFVRWNVSWFILSTLCSELFLIGRFYCCSYPLKQWEMNFYLELNYKWKKLIVLSYFFIILISIILLSINAIQTLIYILHYIPLQPIKSDKNEKLTFYRSIQTIINDAMHLLIVLNNEWSCKSNTHQL